MNSGFQSPGFWIPLGKILQTCGERIEVALTVLDGYRDLLINQTFFLAMLMEQSLSYCISGFYGESFLTKGVLSSVNQPQKYPMHTLRAYVCNL